MKTLTSSPGHPTAMPPGQEPASDSLLARLRLREDQFLAVTPTVLLIGMYGAAAFSLLAMGPAWVGFLLGATPVAGLAVWAFAGDEGARS